MQAAEREHPVGEKDNIDELLKRISGYTSEYVSNDESDMTPERPSSTLSSTTQPLPQGLAAGGGHGSSTTLVVRMIECTPPPSLSKCSSVEELGSASVPQAAVAMSNGGNQGASDIITEAAQIEMTSGDRPDTVVTSAPSGVEGEESVIPAVDGPAMQNAIQASLSSCNLAISLNGSTLYLVLYWDGRSFLTPPRVSRRCLTRRRPHECWGTSHVRKYSTQRRQAASCRFQVRRRLKRWRCATRTRVRLANDPEKGHDESFCFFLGHCQRVATGRATPTSSLALCNVCVCRIKHWSSTNATQASNSKTPLEY